MKFVFHLLLWRVMKTTPLSILQNPVFAALIATLTMNAGAAGSHPSRSQWVYFDPSGKLAYRVMPAGDRILDFSYAGYMGGGVALPAVPVKKALTPSGEDDSAAIQAAMDEVSKLPLVNEVRGAVLLRPGHYRCKDTLKILTSGVILRGSGPDENDTVIELTGDPHLAISILGKRELQPLGVATTVADAYVPAGTLSVHVQDASGFNAGDTVEIVKPATAEWVRFMGMDTLVRNGKKETWVGSDIKVERRIAAVKAKTLVFDVPLADSYDAKYLGHNGTTITKVSDTGQIEIKLAWRTSESSHPHAKSP